MLLRLMYISPRGAWCGSRAAAGPMKSRVLTGAYMRGGSALSSSFGASTFATATISFSFRASGRARIARDFSRKQSTSSSSSSSSSRWQTPRFGHAGKMSSLAGGVGAAGLYAVVSSPAQIGAKPEEAEGKAHHLQNGRGYRNPWDSYTEMSAPRLMLAMLW